MSAIIATDRAAGAMQDVDPPAHRIIQRKIQAPSLSTHATERPRVVRLLCTLIEDFPTLSVVATPGAGKTTAVRQATTSLDRPVTWLTLDRTDVAPGRLITYLEAAIAGEVAHAAGVATRALAAGIAHAESAGLLAEVVGRHPLVLVIDQLEAIDGAHEAQEVIAALIRYRPAGVRLVLISRNELECPLTAAMDLGQMATVSDRELAFTVEEAELALSGIGAQAVEAAAAVDATCGWVTGVLFEAWRSADHVAGVGGEADPLYGYLSSHILDRLPAAEREFLIATSPLDQVTPTRAQALGVSDAAARLAALRHHHLPATWDPNGRAMWCHPRFREYLLDRLARHPDDVLRALRVRHAHLLEQENHLEEATEEFLEIGLTDDAARTAAHALPHVLDRLDFQVVDRWLATLGSAARDASFLAAEVMLAIGRNEYGRGVAVGDRLAASGELENATRQAPGLASMLAWCYFHLGRLEEAKALIANADHDPHTEPVRYMFTLAEDETPESRVAPTLTGGPLDGMVHRVDSARGYLARLRELPESGWARAVSAPWRASALGALGHTAEAARLLEEEALPRSALHALNGLDILLDLDRPDDARAYLERAQEAIRTTGSVFMEMYCTVSECKLELRLGSDPQAILDNLGGLCQRAPVREYRWISQQVDTWSGLALLRLSRNSEAVEVLQRAVDTMVAGDRFLELPAAGVYLAEGLWRTGDESGSDRAADVALSAAGRQGSNHLLIQALRDFPAVVTRRMDAESEVTSEWHRIGRLLASRGVELGRDLGSAIHLADFGGERIEVNGARVRPSIRKAVELLAYLAVQPQHRASREQAMDGLFEGRNDRSAQAYLRQAVYKLREVLPSEAALEMKDGHLALRSSLAPSSDSQRFQAMVAEASHLRGEDRLSALRAALALPEQGVYLPNATSTWFAERRRDLEQLAADARFDAAELAFHGGRYEEAERMLELLLHEDPYRERAWRLLMLIADHLGDEDRLIDAFRRCRLALAEVDLAPSRTTRSIVDRDRRGAERRSPSGAGSRAGRGARPRSASPSAGS